MAPSEPPGARLSRAYYRDLVRPLLRERFPGMPHSAGRLGGGSDVLGLDDAMSRDHDWGLRLSLFVPADAVLAVDAELERMLPVTFAGHPTRFAFTGTTEARHRIDVNTLSSFLDARFGFDPRDGIDDDDWLSLTGQAVLEVTAGPVFADDTGDLGRVRRLLQWYPEDLWRYVLACDWVKVGQELPLMSRAGDVGDDRGSRVIAARLAHVVMHLAYLLERSWPPYAKWFGTLFDRLQCSGEVGSSVDRALQADDWGERQHAIGDALQSLLLLQNELGLTSADDATEPFWDRPYLHPEPDIIVELLSGIRNSRVATRPLGRGSAEQRTDNVDILVDPLARRRLVSTG